MNAFEPHPLLRNAHLMTVVAAFYPRRFPRLPPAAERLFEVETGSRILAHCHWQTSPAEHPTLVLVHGLEGSSRSPYMLGTAEKAFVAGFNAVRLNQRNCGGTEHLTPTLYNAGLSGDLRAVARELAEQDGLREIFLAGFSVGGNLVLKLAGELGVGAPAELRAACAVSPSLDLAACAAAAAELRNRPYEWNFVHSLKEHMRRKVRRFPDRYRLDGLGRVRRLREFDELITAPYSGYQGATDYYARASARRVLADIRIPTLILTSQDDPLVPFASFRDSTIAANPHVTLLVPKCGGHCGFISRAGGKERHWAEARVVEFCRKYSRQLIVDS